MMDISASDTILGDSHLTPPPPSAISKVPANFGYLHNYIRITKRIGRVDIRQDNPEEEFEIVNENILEEDSSSNYVGVVSRKSIMMSKEQPKVHKKRKRNRNQRRKDTKLREAEKEKLKQIITHGHQFGRNHTYCL